jgi:TonB family protein
MAGPPAAAAEPLLPYRPGTPPNEFVRAIDFNKANLRLRSFAMIENAARLGDARAQIAWGAALARGSDPLIVGDIVQGYAWLQIARDGCGGQSSFTRGAIREAQSRMDQARRLMTAEQLQAAEEMAGSYREQCLAAWEEQVRARSAPLFRDDHAVGADIFPDDSPRRIAPGSEAVDGIVDRRGCAAAPDETGCRQAAKTLDAGPHCTGQIMPTPAGLEARKVEPDYPVRELRDGISGGVVALVHVDRSGWVCRAVVVENSGTPALQASVLDAVRRWHIGPAIVDGQAVETMILARFQMSIYGYSFKPDRNE